MDSVQNQVHLHLYTTAFSLHMSMECMKVSGRSQESTTNIHQSSEAQQKQG